MKEPQSEGTASRTSQVLKSPRGEGLWRSRRLRSPKAVHGCHRSLQPSGPSDKLGRDKHEGTLLLDVAPPRSLQ